MQKLKWLRVTNVVLFFSFALQVITSLILFFAIEPLYKPWVPVVHAYNGLLMISLVVAHISLNWGWVKMNFFKRR